MNNNQDEGFIRQNAIWLVVFLALIVFGFLLFKGWDEVVNDEIDGMITITGNFSCLPLKDITVEAPTAEEDCVLGVRSRDGFHYALDVSRIQDANTDLKAEETIAVTGTIEPDETLPTSEWSHYDVVGIIKVNTLLRTR